MQKSVMSYRILEPCSRHGYGSRKPDRYFPRPIHIVTCCAEPNLPSVTGAGMLVSSLDLKQKPSVLVLDGQKA